MKTEFFSYCVYFLIKKKIIRGKDASVDENLSVAKDLAKALAQIARGMEPRFLKEPLSKQLHNCRRIFFFGSFLFDV